VVKFCILLIIDEDIKMILLKFETAIEGDSSVNGHEKWITCESFQFGVGRAISSSGGGSDRETSNPSFSEVSLTKSMDKASVELMMQAAGGKSLGKCEIHFLQTGGTDVQGQVYLTIELGEALISSYSASSGGERPSESISINYTSYSTEYNVFKDGKSVETIAKQGWDLEKNEKL